MTILDEIAAAESRMPAAPRNGVGFWRSPAAKFFLIGALALLLVIPVWMVLTLTSDREQRRDEVVRSVGKEWGAPQDIYGPVLVIPFVMRTPAVTPGSPSPEPVIRHIAVLPETFTVTASAKAEERSVAIYDVPVFSAQVAATGRFGPVDLSVFGSEAATVLWDQAYIAVGLGDLAGVEDATLAVGGRKLELEPGVTGGRAFLAGGGGTMATGPGIHAVLGVTAPIDGFDYALDLRVRGTDALQFAPVGRQSAVTLASNWPHPNFAIGMLPSERDVSDNGFSATWRVPYLARNAPQAWIVERDGFYRFNGDTLGVGFVEPLDFYVLVSRALKYGVMFIGVAFLTVFMLEVLSPHRIHMVQYCLVGLMLVMFFVLLLAFSERVGFDLAYLIAATATGAVISAFVGMALQSRWRAVFAAGDLAASFALLYAILRLEDLALLTGAVIGFIALSVVLFLTRKVDWSGLGTRVAPAPQVQGAAP